MADAARPPNSWMSRMSACTPEPPVPSEPVMVNIVVFICCYRLKLVAKLRKKAETQ
jgi:hypothetical protein